MQIMYKCMSHVAQQSMHSVCIKDGRNQYAIDVVYTSTGCHSGMHVQISIDDLEKARKV